MKKIVLFMTVCFIVSGLCASEIKPAVARISSYLEGIVNLKVSLGEHVKKGQLLFNISTDYTEIIKEKCENGVWFYKEEYKRIKKLGETRSKSVEEVEESRYNYENAVGDLKIQELLIDKWSKYYAPFDGVVTNIYNYNGSGVSSGSGNCNNNDAILEVTNQEDYDKGIVKISPAIAHVAPMITGPVELKVALGEKVKKGQTLFDINMAYNKISSTKHDAKVKYYKAKYERSKILYHQKSDSLKAYQTAKYDFKNAVQDQKGNELIINKRSKYKAPFDGTVTNIIYYSGSNVFIGHKVLEVTKD